MECEESDDFDSLFSAAEQVVRVVSSDLQHQVVTNTLQDSRGGSRGASGPGSRGSPARKGTPNTLCPSNPAVGELKLGGAASRSHSMRDQTDLMKEKYQSRYQQRRMSTKTQQLATPKSGSRNNSIPNEDVVVTRQFLTTNKKIINRGDSFKRRDRPVVNKSKVEIQLNGCSEESQEVGDKVKRMDKVYRVAFLGSGEVGKTSIIDQFMSSEHADVYDDILRSENVEADVDCRMITVDVNGTESRISLIEPAVSDISVSEMVEENNPDCYVIVYAVDDRESFDYAHQSLSWLRKNDCLAGKSGILVGNKADLARSRLVDTTEGCDLAVEFGVKFTETSPGMGHRVDELLVGIVMQLRLREIIGVKSAPAPGSSLKQTVKGLFNILTGKEEEKRKVCRNLNI